MSALVTAFERLIPPKFLLTRQGSYWIVEEPRAGNSRFEVAGGKSHAFTLDQDGVHVLYASGQPILNVEGWVVLQPT